ncbi:SWIM zinc finger family protein [Planococcus kocurii]|uniref:SWIM-type domain-containing protein n=1 Tax=Planococcus kocurii TaxID=1374 RepID=A0ABM5WYZ5_9BACL|nr:MULTISPECIES: hypothetical protein [Planococcus]ALS79587.1 hypothetical protein AUO94_13555 [Planococcus kocurii]KAA0956895.1 hypothetical protein FQ085_10450 [Planococcus sp. ANT_H30]
MNLRNLKTYVPAVIYKRGLDYFERDFVEELTENAPNRWHAVVEGTWDYDITVKLTGEETIVSTSCNCPFESDSLCKHEVAVCLAICEAKKEKSSASVDVRAQLKALKKAELLEIFEELLKKQPAVDLYLTEKFSNASGLDEQTARRIIQNSANRASRRGFIEWDRANQAIEGAEEVQEYVDSLQIEQDAEKMICLSLIVIEECSEMMQMADDSGADISSTINESLAKIDKTLAEWPEQLDESTVDHMLELLYPHILFHLKQDIIDVAGDLLQSVLLWNEKGDFADKFYDFIEKVIGSREMQNQSYSYTEEQFRMCQLVILQQAGDQQAIESFCMKHHRYSGIRKAQILQALDAGEFEKVIRLCAESEQLDVKSAGLIQDWKKLRFRAYEGMGNKAGMVDLSYQFALDGEQEYYNKLRSLVVVEDWPKKMEAMLAEMKMRPRCRPLYLGILIDEKRFAELLDYCEKDVAAIERLHPHLVADYPHEVNEIYTSYIYRLVEPASNRKAYWSACQKINGFQQALGADAAKRLIEELKFMYPKRKAFLDELGKVEGK